LIKVEKLSRFSIIIFLFRCYLCVLFFAKEMIPFKRIELSDADTIKKYLRLTTVPICDFSFATIFCWREMYKTTFAEWKGFLLLRFFADNEWQYLSPIGIVNLAEVLSDLMNEAEQRGETFIIGAATPELFEPIEKALPDKFIFTEERNQFEYIYSREKLATLSGKKLQPKRNHINHFIGKYPSFSYELISSENIAQCTAVYDAWENEHTQEHSDENLKYERKSVELALEHFFDFGLRGIILKIDGKAVAFAYGEKVNGNTFVVHTEKTLPNFRDSYVMINKLTAEHLAYDCEYINREEDMGLESLRTAKMQYHPEKFLRKGTIKIKHSIDFDISHPDTKDEQQIKQLWADTFADSTDFIESFFAKIFQPKCTWIAKHDEKVIASTQFLPYTYKNARGETLTASYVFCVMTHKNYRNHGAMSKLMSIAIDEERKKSTDFLFLIPVDNYAFSFYERIGFVKSFSTTAMHIDESHLTTYRKTAKNVDELYNLYKKYYVGRNCILLSEKQFQFSYDDFSKHNLEIYEKNENFLLLTNENGQKILVFALFKNENEEQLFFDEICQNKQNTNCGMALILNEHKINYEQLKNVRLSFLYEI